MIKYRNDFQRSFYNAIVIIIILTFASGCIPSYKQPIHNISLNPVQNKINLSVNLLLSDSFRNAQIEIPNVNLGFSMDTIAIPIGENLEFHANQLVKNVFTDPIIPDANSMSEGEAIFPTTQEYSLIPTFLNANYQTISRGRAMFTLTVQWVLLNKSSEKIIWADTIIGEGEDGWQNFRKGEIEEQIGTALQNLFEKTQSAMLCSKILRNLSELPIP